MKVIIIIKMLAEKQCEVVKSIDPEIKLPDLNLKHCYLQIIWF